MLMLNENIAKQNIENKFYVAKFSVLFIRSINSQLISLCYREYKNCDLYVVFSLVVFTVTLRVDWTLQENLGILKKYA